MRGAHAERVNKTFRLRLEWVKKAEKRAIDEQRSLTSVVEEALERYAAGSEDDGAARLIANARARTGERRRQFGGRFPEGGPLTRDQAYER
jgi:hypothetical protein